MDKLISKSECMLLIYDYLIRNEKLLLNDLVVRFKISRRTAIRYLGEVRDFIEKYHPGKTIEYSFKERSLVIIDK